MVYKWLLISLLFFSFTSAASADSAAIESTEAPLIVSADKLRTISITKKEKFYILSECKQFAIDDEIEAEFVYDYIEVCTYELTQAVKTAKYQLKKKKAKVRPVNTKKASPLQAL